METIISAVFILEIYHVISHILVMTGYRTLPRKVLAKQRYYFLADLICSLGAFMIHGRFWLMVLLQNLQHAFYFLTWPDDSWITSRVLSWSSLDWDRGRWNQLDLVIGTSFDIFTHLMNAYFLSQLLACQWNTVAMCILVDLLLVVLVLFNPNLAWSNAN